MKHKVEYALTGILILVLFIVGNCVNREVLDSGITSYVDICYLDMLPTVKRQLLDPDSFQLDNTKYRYNEDGFLEIVMLFRSKNSFGGYVQGVAYTLFDFNGKHMSELEIKLGKECGVWAEIFSKGDWIDYESKEQYKY